MGRGAEKVATNLSQQNQQQFSAQQKQALGAQNKATAEYKKQASDILVNDPWQDPKYVTGMKRLAQTVSKGTHTAANAQLKNFDLRTGGQNTAQVGAISREDKRARERGAQEYLDTQKAMDWDKYQDLRKFGVSALGEIPKTYQQNYATASEGITNATKQAVQLANKPGSGLLGSGLGAAGSVAAALIICPCRGSLILLEDYRQVLVEELRAGDQVRAVDGGTDKIVRDPDPTRAEGCLRVTTESGKAASVTPTHTFLRPHGGYVTAASCRGEMVKTRDGDERVVSVETIGAQTVYPLVLDRTHTYLVDGIWSEQ